MRRWSWRGWLVALAAVATVACPADPAAAAGPGEEAPAPNLTSETVDLHNGYGQTLWRDAEGRPYDLGMVFPLPRADAGPAAYTAAYASETGEAPPAVAAALDHAAATYGVSGRCLWTIARRESRFRPWVDNAQGSGARGLMQFKDGTWSTLSRRAGYGGASVYDPWAAAHVTAWAIANPGPSEGGLRHWGSC